MIFLLLTIPLLFIINILLHESSHAFVAYLCGIKSRIRLFIDFRTFGRTELDSPIPEKYCNIFLISPLLLSMFIWSISMTICVFLSGIAFMIVISECIACLIDSLIWLLGLFTDRKTSDSVRLRDRLGLDKNVKFYAFLWLIPATMTLSLMLFTI